MMKSSYLTACLILLLVGIASSATATLFNTWATDPTGSYPVAVNTANSVLIGTTLGCSFEQYYAGLDTLLDMFGEAIVSHTNPSVGIYAAHTPGNGVGMAWAMNELGITDYDATEVDIRNPMSVDLAALNQYDVVVLDAAANVRNFAVGSGSLEAMKQYLDGGGRIVASAYIFVDWYDYNRWGRQLHNQDLACLFGGAIPDPTVFVDSAIWGSQAVLTINAVYPWLSKPSDPYFHFFYELEPIPEPGTLLLLGTGLAGLAGYGVRFRRRKRK